MLTRERLHVGKYSVTGVSRDKKWAYILKKGTLVVTDILQIHRMNKAM